MNALSKLFEVLHLSRGEMTLRRSHRRRRARRRESSLSCETLEPKQLLAADVAVQFSDQVFDTTDPLTVAIEGKFGDTDVSGTVVKFETNAPLSDNDFYIELTDNTPLTNANFLSYVNSGAYDNSKFHRSVTDFVIQGGGFQTPAVAADQPGSDPVAIPTTGTVQNEPGNLNTRGTIAMAKLGGQPDSATSQFFFNLNNNSFLDSDNGGYTVFGDVLGSGMTVVDTMAGALTYDATTYYSNTALSDLPLWNVNQDNIVRPNDFVKIENADVVTESDLFTYQVSSSDAAKLTASFDGNGNLVLTPGSSATGSVDVTVTATSSLITQPPATHFLCS
jgi:peptidylprolyl isomerase